MPICPKCKKTIDRLPCPDCGLDRAEFAEKYAKKDGTDEF